MPRVYEILKKGLTPVEAFNHQVRDELADLIDTIKLLMAPASFEEPMSSHNPITLSSGVHGGALLTKADTHIKAVPAGVKMTRKAIFTVDAQVDGVRLTTLFDTSGADSLVELNGTAVVVFRGCTFDKAPADAATYITVANGAKAIFTGCVFAGTTGAAGDLFSHAGAAANVQLVGCYNKTGHIYGANTTTTACI
jgi:hypothetical protein